MALYLGDQLVSLTSVNNASDTVKSTTVTEIMTLTESQYEAILHPSDTILYIIKES